MEIVDAAGVEAFLSERLEGGVSDVVAFEQGLWSRAFAFRQAGRDFVVRFSALREDFDKDRLAAQYRSAAMPIPRVVEIEEGLGGFYAVSERLFGTYIDDADEAQMRALLPSLFAALDGMRLADISGFTGYGIWCSDGNAPHPSWRAALLDVANDRPTDRISGWRERLVSSPTGAGPFDEAYRRLQTLVPHIPESRHLIHSDLLHFNVLVQNDRISGLLDWGCGMYGDFLYDLAWLCFWSPWYIAWKQTDFRGEALRHYASIGLDVPRFEERLLAYQIQIGLGGQAYQAFTERWSDLAWTARRTLEVVRSSP